MSIHEKSSGGGAESQRSKILCWPVFMVLSCLNNLLAELLVLRNTKLGHIWDWCLWGLASKDVL